MMTLVAFESLMAVEIRSIIHIHLPKMLRP